MKQRRILRGPVVGLATGLLVMVTLNLLVPRSGIANAQDNATPTPGAPQAEDETTPTPTPTATSTPSPTPLPSLELRATTELAPAGDLNSDGLVNPGDSMLYTVAVLNTGEPIGPFEVVASYDRTFVSGVTSISAGGAADENQVVWLLEGLDSGGEATLSFQVQLKRLFPPGRTQVTGTLIARSGAAELGRAPIPAYEVVGPNLRLVDETVELVTDADANGRIDPGDTIRFTILYSNSGGGPSQEAAVVADYPDALTQSVIANPDNGIERDGMLVWGIGSVPADGEVRSVQFAVQLVPEFPSGVTVYELLARIDGATATLDQRSLAVNVSGPNLVATVDPTFVVDQNENALLDPGDQVQLTINYSNVGTDTASGVQITATFDTAIFEVSETLEGRTDNIREGVVTWTFPLLEAGASGSVGVIASVKTLPAAVSEIKVPVTIVSDQTPLAQVEAPLAVNAPTPTPAGPATPPAVVSDVRVAQGQGILSVPSVSILIGAFLFLSLLSLIFVASRVLPDTSAERLEVDTEAEQAAQRRLVRELIEGVVLTAILFTVMILGLQNALDRESINAIIGGIVGYVAGRVSGSR